MTQRVSLSILLCTLAALTAQAQWSKQDSLRLQQLLNGEEELGTFIKYYKISQLIHTQIIAN